MGYDILPDKNLCSMAAILLQMADGLLVCVQNMQINRPAAAAESKKVKKLENIMNVRYHESIAELFSSDDFKKILKLLHLYLKTERYDCQNIVIHTREREYVLLHNIFRML